MTVPFPVIVLALVAAIGLAGFIAWVIYQLLPEKVFLRDQTIVKKHRGKIEEMAISEVSEIKYHYHAVVGFVAVWEFIGRNAKRLLVHSEAKGVDHVLSTLEKTLPGFSLSESERKFGEGDVEDVIDVWKAA
jgi:hypothetical protein